MPEDRTTWWAENESDAADAKIAYFSMEFGIDESLPIYSGGLGVLAGDHLKAAAELRIPLLGGGPPFPGGYLPQGGLSPGGRRQEGAPDRPAPARRPGARGPRPGAGHGRRRPRRAHRLRGG